MRPSSTLKQEYEKLHDELMRVTKSGGRTGEAAEKVNYCFNLTSDNFPLREVIDVRYASHLDKRPC